jgi:hypothetical protein
MDMDASLFPKGLEVAMSIERRVACMAECDKALHPASGERINRDSGFKGSLRRALPALDAQVSVAASKGRSLSSQRHQRAKVEVRPTT